MGKENPIVRGAKALVRSPWGRVGVTALTLAGSACGIKSVSEVPITSTPQATATPCNPEQFVKEHNIEPPVAIGGDQSNIPPKVMDAARKLGACQTPTAEEQAAIHEFNQEHPFLGWAPAAVLSKETAKIVNPSPQELQQARQEALARSEQRLVFQKDIFDIGGKIEQSIQDGRGDIGLLVKISPGQRITFLSPVEGEIVSAKASNDKTTNIIVIQSGDVQWYISSPSTGILAKELVKGAKVSLRTLLFSVTYDPASEIQKSFEERATVLIAGTVVMIGHVDKSTGNSKTTISENVLQNAQGEFLTQG